MLLSLKGEEEQVKLYDVLRACQWDFVPIFL